MAKYRYVGDHADFVQKGDKSIPVAPGDFVDLTEKEASENDHGDALVAIADMKGDKNG